MKLIYALTLGLMTATAVLAQEAMPQSQGTITKIDTKWKKVTIDHGPLENLDMPGMKMVFGYADGMMDGLTEGTKVLFVADRVNGKLTVTEITAE